MLFNGDPLSHLKSACDLVFDGHYREVGQRYKLASLLYAERCGSSNWRAVATEFNAALMKAADFPGRPQSIIARFAQKLSCLLMRERQKYTHDNPQVRSLQELRKTLTDLKMETEWNT